MKWMLVMFTACCFLFSCSYLPDESVDPSHLKEEKGDYAVYYSGSVMPEHAFMMVPGGLVDPHVYACWIERLVEMDSSFSVVLLKYPSNLAITNSKKAMRVARNLSQVNHWIIGGHSLGGVVATSVVRKDRDYFDGLVLLASWALPSADLSGWDRQVVSIFASEDQIATKEEIFQNSAYLPEGDSLTFPVVFPSVSNRTYYIEIEGGNHSGFGCYGMQEGDRIPLITPLEQQDQLVQILNAYFDLIW